MSARNPEKLAAVAADLKVRGAHFVDTAVADLDDTDKHPALLAHAINSLTGLDVAYLAHGVLGDQAAAEADFTTAEQIFHTNLTAPVSLLTWLANHFVQRKSGVLAVISSVAGDRGRKSNYVYGASKSRSLRLPRRPSQPCRPRGRHRPHHQTRPRQDRHDLFHEGQRKVR